MKKSFLRSLPLIPLLVACSASGQGAGSTPTAEVPAGLQVSTAWDAKDCLNYYLVRDGVILTSAPTGFCRTIEAGIPHAYNLYWKDKNPSTWYVSVDETNPGKVSWWFPVDGRWRSCSRDDCAHTLDHGFDYVAMPEAEKAARAAALLYVQADEIDVQTKALALLDQVLFARGGQVLGDEAAVILERRNQLRQDMDALAQLREATLAAAAAAQGGRLPANAADLFGQGRQWVSTIVVGAPSCTDRYANC